MAGLVALALVPGHAASTPGSRPALAGPERTALLHTLGRLDPSLRIGAVASGLQATNVQQHLRARFTNAGLTLDVAGAELRMRASTLTTGASATALAPVRPRLIGGRAVYRHPGLSEWYANEPQGVEQGFTIARPRSSAAHLQIALSVSASAHAKLLSGGHSVAFGDGLRYGRLAARDARGRVLPSSIRVSGNGVELNVDARGASYPINVDPLYEHENERLTTAGEGDWFGYSVAMSGDGDTVVVGAPHASGETGAAWVFVRSGTAWTTQAALNLPPSALATGRPGAAVHSAAGDEETAGDHFGASVALSEDGNTAIVSSPGLEEGRGAVWVFSRTGSSWGAPTKLVAGSGEHGEGRFGRGLALTPDGGTVVVGAPRDANGTGAAWLFKRHESEWAPGPELTASDTIGEAHFGGSVAISAAADTVLVGGPGDHGYVGKAWVFASEGEGEGFGAPTTLTGAPASAGEGHFGRDVALSAAGDTALVGAPGDAAGAGRAYVFARSAGHWSPQGPALAGAEEGGEAGFGYSTALSADGATALIGGPHDSGAAAAGAAWEFARTGGVWAQEGPKLVLRAPEARGEFGYDLALDSAADRAVFGALRPYDRAPATAWVFTTQPPTGGGTSSEPPPHKEHKQPPSEPPTTTPSPGQTGGVLGFAEAHPLTPAQQSAAASASRVTLASRTINVRAKGRAAVRLACAGSTRCSGRLALITYRRAGRHIVKHTIGSASFRIAPGKATVTLVLTTRGRRYLSARHGRLNAALSILTPPSRAQTAAVKLRLQPVSLRRTAKRR